MPETLLRAEGIRRTYQMGRVRLDVLRDCGLRVAPGEFVAIMGKSGSGKSTLLHILGALDVPQDGQVYFDDAPVFAPPQQRWQATSALDVLSSFERRRIGLRRHAFGFVFQFYHLLPELNVLENVLVARMIGTPTLRWSAARQAARADALAVLTRVGLHERLRHRPSELSGGERQRVAIARALVHKPRILFADEPTGNLDAEAGASLMGLLKALHGEGQTIVMVTHDAGVASQADRILRLENGQLRGV
ncbi:MAG: ABC transporter ATP-binding protein [Phycisphaerales bacterium]|nr:ABC transporter ATP-binding protein [Phycisphaerales bacterium]